MKSVEATEKPVQETISDLVLNNKPLEANAEDVLRNLSEQITELSQKLAFKNSENDILRAEIKRLNQEK